MENLFNQSEVTRAEEVQTLTVKDSFSEFKKQADEWMQKAKTIIVTDATQVSLMREAGEARKALKKVRTSVEAKRKELKEDALRYGQQVDQAAKELRELIEPIEAYLEEQEKFAEIAEAKRKKELAERRKEELSYFGTDTSFYDLENMPEERYLALLESEKRLSEEKAAAEAEAKKQEEIVRNNAILAEKRLAETMPFQYLNTFGKYPARKKEYHEYTEEEWKHFMEVVRKYDAEYKAEQDKIRKENEELQKKLAEEQKKQAEELEELKKKQEEENAALRAKEEEERNERIKIQAELDAKKRAEEEEKSRKDALIAEEKEKARLLAVAPDKDKLLSLIPQIESIAINGDLSSPEAQKIFSDVKILFGKTITFINQKVESL